VLHDFIIVAVVVGCLVAIHFAFDAMQRRNVKRLVRRACSQCAGTIVADVGIATSLDRAFVWRLTFPHM
jgi:hypothetical protein